MFVNACLIYRGRKKNTLTIDLLKEVWREKKRSFSLINKAKQALKNTHCRFVDKLFARRVFFVSFHFSFVVVILKTITISSLSKSNNFFLRSLSFIHCIIFDCLLFRFSYQRPCARLRVTLINKWQIKRQPWAKST